jgi:hypothetical protein
METRDGRKQCANIKNVKFLTNTTMATRNGKIANLPNDVREQLNLRLLEGETGRELAAWLNALPEVQSVLGLQFNGSPISEVNLTYWRQGGYLQWITERECFDSARALAEGDCDLAKTGISAERLLNVLTLRYGQLLMQWELPLDEGVSDTEAFAVTARKARILQGISRSVLAIHRIQLRSDHEKSGPATASAHSSASSEKHASPSSATAERLAIPQPREKATSQPGTRPSAPPPPQSAIASPGIGSAEPHDRGVLGGPATAGERGERIPKALSGPIVPLSVPSNLSHSPFRADLDLNEILKAV